ncbi:hypothetical protein BCR33DRAFT_853054 [Rhizoclosmatium globosum]|uniref:Peptidase M48 domain-containing protein n=1 Tax=Rhizoclosmatium globosum TaxID=329046 RepID=A0A1Y2BZ57_9FUNG|nr:hypothetical protein BCR33DRAFT_853054 [Rhizoclosmatium globosum]|eukprot:ORY39927.1 hypothetical protein BCR33DRAFT_853054 [Rhizoclosmatium globosum]
MTQRARLMLISEQDEMATAAEAFELLKQMHGPKLIHPSHPIVKSTQRIVDRLVAVVGKDLREWELFVIDDPNTVNAMQLKPSNSSTSWFQATLNFFWSLRSSHQHPIPSTLNHIQSTLIRWPQYLLTKWLTCFQDILLRIWEQHNCFKSSRCNSRTLYIFSINLPFLGDVVGRSVDVAAPYLSTLPYSRLMEIEADVIGIFLMAVAGYNPQRASQFWQHLASQDLANSPTHPFAEFTSTHPSHTHRAIELAKHEPAASEIYKAHKRIEDALKLNLARAKNSVLGEFIGGKDTFWYARRDFDKVFIERSLRIVEE